MNKDLLPDSQIAILKEAATLAKKNKQNRAKEIADARQKIALSAKDIKKSDMFNVYNADITTWQNTKQYDFIITDPPYPKEFLNLYEVLAMRSNEWLKDGGLVVAMCGQMYLNEIYQSMSKHLDYYWTACYLTQGQPTPLRHVNVNTTWKPLLIFKKKNDSYKGKIFGDVIVSSGNDKTHHKWGQSVSGMYDLINRLCLPGQSILDPFCGAGTTGIAALKHNCFFDGVELDKTNTEISIARIGTQQHNINDFFQ